MLRIPAIGIVGTRQPSAHGLAVARAVAAACVAEGWAVVSGVARGIDEAAHDAALRAGGRTIGVLPSPAPQGLRQGARGLGRRMVATGALLSDRPPGTPPAAWSFVSRNSLLAALCDGLIVIEAPEGSGALITAEAATELGIPLAFVTAPYGAKSAAGGLSWLARTVEPTLLPLKCPHRNYSSMSGDFTRGFASVQRRCTKTQLSVRQMQTPLLHHRHQTGCAV